jgi:hypothetical protein
MSPSPPRAPQPGQLLALARIIDWKLVAAIGLPLWAFVIGIVIAWNPRLPSPPPAESDETAAVAPHPAQPNPPPAPPTPAPVETIPMPREIVVRTEVVRVPVEVPVEVPVPARSEPVAAAPPAPAPLDFPAPAGKCKTYDTKVHFHPTITEAKDEAKKSGKMVFVLHISGDFDDPGFT